MARSVRQGCQASGFLFAMAFDPIFRWLQDAIIPRNPPGLDFLQQVPCAGADDFEVAASSFQRLMTALIPAFQTMDQIAGLTLNHRKCCWVQCGSESCQSLLEWVATNCEEFREMKIVKYARCWHHDWTGRPYSPLDGTSKTIHSTCPENQRLYHNIYAFSVLGYIGSISAPDGATLKAEAHARVRPWT